MYAMSKSTRQAASIQRGRQRPTGLNRHQQHQQQDATHSVNSYRYRKRRVDAAAKKFVWEFEDDHGHYIPFPNNNNQEIERAYSSGQTTCEYTIHGNSYKLDFAARTQTNMSTNKQRQVRRRDPPTSDDTPTIHYWEFQTDDGNYSIMNNTAQIEVAFASGETTWDFRLDAKRRYQIDFQKRQQTNLQTGKVRRLERREYRDQDFDPPLQNAFCYWEYQQSNGRYVLLSNSAEIEAAYASRWSAIDYSSPTNNNNNGSIRRSYRLDFKTNTQTNLRDDTCVQAVRRVVRQRKMAAAAQKKAAKKNPTVATLKKNPGKKKPPSFDDSDGAMSI